MALAHLVPIWFSISFFFTPSSPHSFSSVTLLSLLVLKHRSDAVLPLIPLPGILSSQASIALTTHLQVFLKSHLPDHFESVLKPVSTPSSPDAISLSPLFLFLTHITQRHIITYLVSLPSNSFQYSCLGNPLDRGAWQATVHGVTSVRHHLVTKTL